MYDIDTASGHHFNYSALFMNIKFDSDSSQGRIQDFF